MTRSSEDTRRIQDSIRRRGITSLFHYTRVSSLPSIFTADALLSRSQMDTMSMSYTGHTWGYNGKEVEFADYICCGFLPHWGMMGKESELLCVFELKADLIWHEGTLFCPDNSALNDYTLDHLQAHNTADDFDEMFPDQTTYRTRSWQAEILVYHRIPLSEVSMLHFRTRGELDQARTLVQAARLAQAQSPALRPIAVSISPRRFPPSLSG